MSHHEYAVTCETDGLGVDPLSRVYPCPRECEGHLRPAGIVTPTGTERGLACTECAYTERT